MKKFCPIINKLCPESGCGAWVDEPEQLEISYFTASDCGITFLTTGRTKYRCLRKMNVTKYTGKYNEQCYTTVKSSKYPQSPLTKDIIDDWNAKQE